MSSSSSSLKTNEEEDHNGTTTNNEDETATGDSHHHHASTSKASPNQNATEQPQEGGSDRTPTPTAPSKSSETQKRRAQLAAELEAAEQAVKAYAKGILSLTGHPTSGTVAPGVGIEVQDIKRDDEAATRLPSKMEAAAAAADSDACLKSHAKEILSLTRTQTRPAVGIGIRAQEDQRDQDQEEGKGEGGATMNKSCAQAFPTKTKAASAAAASSGTEEKKRPASASVAKIPAAAEAATSAASSAEEKKRPAYASASAARTPAAAAGHHYRKKKSAATNDTKATRSSHHDDDAAAEVPDMIYYYNDDDDQEMDKDGSTSSDALPLIMDRLPYLTVDEQSSSMTNGEEEEGQTQASRPPAAPRRPEPESRPGAFYVGPTFQEHDDDDLEAGEEEEEHHYNRYHEVLEPVSQHPNVLQAYLFNDGDDDDDDDDDDENPHPPKRRHRHRKPLFGEEDPTTTPRDSSTTQEAASNSSRSLLAVPPLLPDDLVERESEGQDEQNRSSARTGLGTAGILVLLAALLLLIGFMIVRNSLSEAGGDDFDDIDMEEDLGSGVLPIQEQPWSSPTLIRIHEQGVLKCAPKPTPLGLLFCQIFAAAIFGDSFTPERVQEFDYQGNDQLMALADGEVDVVMRGMTPDLDRQVHEESTSIGLSFSTPVYMVGTQVAGKPFYVSCVEKDFYHLEECSGLRICVWSNSTHHEVMNKLLPQSKLVIRHTYEEVIEGFVQGDCNVLSSNAYYIAEQPIRKAGYEGEYVVSDRFLTRRALSAAFRSDDPAFVDFINFVLGALVAAEAHNITKASADSFPQTNLFGAQYKNVFRDALRLVGNYGELYEKHFDPIDPRQPFNRVNNGTTGLLMSAPFGNLKGNQREADYKLKPTMQAIVDRGVLNCGIKADLPGFSMKRLDSDRAVEHHGMDVDYCHALAASLFQGDSSKLKFVEVENATDGFVLLAGSEIDVLAGATWNLQNDVKEPTTGLGFTFSRPYFYGYSLEEENFSLATRQDDHEWSAFVSWIVQAPIYAEQEGIGIGASSIQMPEVFLFGSRMNRMLRDAILTVGNYGEMYEHNLQVHIPRAAPNTLNNNTLPGPQHYEIPGYFK